MAVAPAGQNYTPINWPIQIRTGDRLRAVSGDVEVLDAAGTATGLTVTGTLAQVRTAPGAASVALTIPTSYSGSEVTWGGVTVTLDQGTYYWDLEVTTSETGLMTWLAGEFIVTEGVSEA